MEPENFACQGKTWTRETLLDFSVVVERRESESRYCPTVSVTWEGRHILSDGSQELIVERSTVTDAGKLGASLTYTETVKPVSVGSALDEMGWKAV